MRILIVFFIFLSFNLSSSGGACGEYLSNDGLHKGVCDQVNIDPSDKASLQRGLKLYVNYCFGCHSLKYARYSSVSMDLDIPEDLFKENLLFGDQQIGDLNISNKFPMGITIPGFTQYSFTAKGSP